MQIVFHVGMHKTGTTYLQKIVFPKYFTNSCCIYKKNAKKTLSNKSFHLNKVNLLSHENWSNSIRNPSEGWNAFVRFLDIINNLDNGLELKIIIVLRRHIDYVWSAYLHELKMRRKVSISFEEYVNSFGVKGLSWSDRIYGLLDYSFIALDYQEMQDDIEQFLCRIADFIGFELDSYKNIENNMNRNITPRTFQEMEACQKFEKVYQDITRTFKSVTGKVLPTEALRVYLRDISIQVVSKKTTNPNPIIRPYLSEEIQDIFEADWDLAWSTYHNYLKRKEI